MKLKLFLFLLAFILISISYVLGTERHAVLNQALLLIFPIFATFSGLLATKIYGLKSITGKSLLSITLGFACLALGEIIWFFYKNILGIDPFPSIADVFFLLGYPLILAGLYLEFKKSQIQLHQIKKSLIVLSLSLTLTLSIIVLYFGIYLAYDPSVGLLANIIAMSYGVVDLILIIISLFALLIVHAYRGGKFSTFWITTILGILLFLAGDILFAIYNIPYTADIKPYIYIDLIWIAGYLSLAYGMLDNYFHIRTIHREIRSQQN